MILRSAWLTGELDSELAGEIFLGQGTPRLLLPGGVALFGGYRYDETWKLSAAGPGASVQVIWVGPNLPSNGVSILRNRGTAR